MWSIDRVILALMNREELGDGSFEEYDEDESPSYQPGVRQYYSDRCPKLVELVDESVKVQPDERPTPTELWNDIQKEVGKISSLAGLPLKLTAIPATDAQPLRSGETPMETAMGLTIVSID